MKEKNRSRSLTYIRLWPCELGLVEQRSHCIEMITSRTMCTLKFRSGTILEI
jgi:hypothetical protein